MPKVEGARYRCAAGHESSSTKPKAWQRCPVAGCDKAARRIEIEGARPNPQEPPIKRQGRVSAQGAPQPPEAAGEVPPTTNQPAPEPPGATRRPNLEVEKRAADLLGPF